MMMHPRGIDEKGWRFEELGLGLQRERREDQGILSLFLHICGISGYSISLCGIFSYYHVNIRRDRVLHAPFSCRHRINFVKPSQLLLLISVASSSSSSFRNHVCLW
jgi:hypothetical protein